MVIINLKNQELAEFGEKVVSAENGMLKVQVKHKGRTDVYAYFPMENVLSYKEVPDNDHKA